MRKRLLFVLALLVTSLACSRGNSFSLQRQDGMANVVLGRVRGDVQTVRVVTVTKPIVPPATVQLVGTSSGAIVPQEGQFPATAGVGVAAFEFRVVITPGGSQTTLHGWFTLRFESQGNELVHDVDVSLQAEVEAPVGLVVHDLDFGAAALGRVASRALRVENPNQATPVEVFSTSITADGDFSIEPGHGAGAARPNDRFPLLIRYFPVELGPSKVAVVTLETSFGSVSATVSGAGVPPPPPPEEPEPDPEPDSEPKPDTVIYFRAGSGVWSMDPDGGNKTLVVTLPAGARATDASHELHDGKRWFLVQIDTGELLSRGKRRELTAISDRGDEVVLWSKPGEDATGPSKRRRWGKDDSFVSFLVRRPDDGTVRILRADVDWGTGSPVLGTPEEVVAGFLNPAATLQGLSSLGSHDWSPDGRRIAYNERIDNFFSQRIVVKDLDSGATTSLGDHRWLPEWAPDGSRVAFSTGGSNFFRGPLARGIYTIKPDDTGLVAVATRSTEFPQNPFWSPEGDRLLFHVLQDILSVPATGSVETNLTSDIGDVGPEVIGWRTVK